MSVDGYDDSIDKLDIYSKFLGEEEYLRMKDSYHRALSTMTELHEIEKERINMNAPCTYSDLTEKYPLDLVQRFQSVHDTYSKTGKSRDKLTQRLELEFK